MNPLMLQYFLSTNENEKNKECNYIRNLMYTLICDTKLNVKTCKNFTTSCNVDPSKLYFLKYESFSTCNGHEDFVKRLKDSFDLNLKIFNISTIEKGRIHFDVSNKTLTYFQKRD